MVSLSSNSYKTLELLRGGVVDAGEMMNPIICSIVEVLSDIGIRKNGPVIEDNLILTDEEKTKITSKSHPAEPAELWIDVRKQRVQLTNRKEFQIETPQIFLKRALRNSFQRLLFKFSSINL